MKYEPDPSTYARDKWVITIVTTLDSPCRSWLIDPLLFLDISQTAYGIVQFPVLDPIGPPCTESEKVFRVTIPNLNVEELAGVDDGLGHHVLEARLLHRPADLLALRDGGRHGYGAHDVLPGAQGLE